MTTPTFKQLQHEVEWLTAHTKALRDHLQRIEAASRELLRALTEGDPYLVQAIELRDLLGLFDYERNADGTEYHH
jgi:hypothetical protein